MLEYLNSLNERSSICIVIFYVLIILILAEERKCDKILYNLRKPNLSDHGETYYLLVKIVKEDTSWFLKSRARVIKREKCIIG